MTLREALSHKNIAGLPYGCDIDKWLEIDIGFKKRKELQHLLGEMQNYSALSLKIPLQTR